jgi:hypothetical protein
MKAIVAAQISRCALLRIIGLAASAVAIVLAALA